MSASVSSVEVWLEGAHAAQQRCIKYSDLKYKYKYKAARAISNSTSCDLGGLADHREQLGAGDDDAHCS